MGQSGELVFYTESELGDPGGSLRAVLGLSGADGTWSVTRSLGPDRSWQAFREELERDRAIVGVDEDLVPTECVGERLAIESIPQLFVPNRTMSAQPAQSLLERGCVVR